MGHKLNSCLTTRDFISAVPVLYYSRYNYVLYTYCIHLVDFIINGNIQVFKVDNKHRVVKWTISTQLSCEQYKTLFVKWTITPNCQVDNKHTVLNWTTNSSKVDNKHSRYTVK